MLRHIGLPTALAALIIGACSYQIGLTDIEAPQPASVTPAIGNSADRVAVVIEGANFLRVPRATPNAGGSTLDAEFEASLSGPAGSADLEEVRWVDDGHLSAVVPAGRLPDGVYDLTVTGPSGKTGTKAQAYRATATPGPIIVRVDPPGAVNDVDANVAVVGDAFDETAAVRLVPAAGEPIPLAAQPGSTQTRTSRLVVVPAGLAPGAYGVSVENADTQRAELAGGLRVATPARLTIAVSAPAQVSIGQSFPVAVLVGNSGGSAALGVAVQSFAQGSGSATTALPVPERADVPAGGEVSFTVTATALTPGTLRFTASAAGSNEFSGRPVPEVSAATGTIDVQDAAILTASFSASPNPVPSGQTTTVELRVQNTGGAPARDVAPGVVILNGQGALELLSGPEPATAAIASGGEAVFRYSYRGTASGAVALSTTVQGFDANSGRPLSAAASGSVEVQTPASLAITSFVLPATLSRGQTFNAVVVVVNLGLAAARDVTLSNPTTSVTGGAAATINGAVAPASIPGGQSATFNLSVTENGTAGGTLALNCLASGFDAVNGQPLTSAPTSSNVAKVQTAPALVVESFTLPASVSSGGTFVASATVRNTGEATAAAVLPEPNPPAVSASPGVTAVTTSAPLPSLIPGGGSATFTWTWSVSGTGTLALSTGARGSDANSGSPVSAPAVASNTAQVLAPSGLTISSLTLPSTLSRGQTFAATMTVRNDGGTTANGVLPDSPVVTATGGANASTSTTFTAVNIPSGGSAQFTWTFTENGAGPGTLTLAAGASGTDAASGASVTASDLPSNTAQVQLPAALVVESFTLPARLSQDQTFTATMVVRNTGQATAQEVLPNPNPPSIKATGGAAATTSTPLTPATIPGGGTATFQWTLQEGGNGSGTITLTSGARGTDANSAAPLSAPSLSSNSATVQTPAQLVISAFEAPARISRGQTFTATLTVRNTGQGAANAVIPAPATPTVSATGRAAATTSTTQLPVTVPGNGSATFTWTFVESGSGAGSLVLSAGASGVDANSGQALSATAFSTASIAVQEPARLWVSSITVPSAITRGQTFAATMVVENSGGTTASAVLPTPNPPSVTAAGGAGASTATAVAPASIPAGGSATFTWTYRENGTGPGTLVLTAGASGTDANTGAAVVAASASSTPLSVNTPAALRVDSLTAPPTITRGQTFNTVLTVTNTGSSTAQDVLPSPMPPSVSAAGGAAATTSTTLTPQTLAAGASASFVITWRESGTAPGTLAFTAGATGRDAISSTSISAAALQSGTVTVQSPPRLTVASLTVPTLLSRGQAFTAEAVIRNDGQATARNVLPSPNPPAVTVTGAAAATTSTSLVPANIPGGQSMKFVWSYAESGTGTGTLQLATGAAGIDANSGAAVNAASLSSNRATVQTPAALSVSAFSIPGQISRGQTFTATMVVTNTGQAAATGVLPSPNPPELMFTLAAGAALISPSPTAATLPGGGSTTFSWTFRENGTGPGTLWLRAAASGIDANSGVGASTAASTSNTANVVSPSNLVITSFTAPATITRGQVFPVTMTVRNDGGVTAQNVRPNPVVPTVAATGTAAAATTSNPAATNIASGQSATFTWSFVENGTGPGTLSFTAGAQGTDGSNANPTSTNLVQVQSPASLQVSSLTVPARLSRGQAFTATMVVTNTGQAAAKDVLPSPNPPTLRQVTGSAFATTATALAPLTIQPGASATFSWTYAENGSGTGVIELSAGASGRDANSDLSITAPQVASNQATVQNPASLRVTSLSLPSAISRGQTFTATMVVTNAGQAEATGVLPAPTPPTKTLTGAADATTSTVLSAQTIPGGGTATFSWTWQENGTGPGTIALAAGVNGTDANSGTAFSAATVTSSPCAVQAPAALEIASFTLPATVTRGQTFNATMVVRNAGGATANGVLPTPNPPGKALTGGADAATGSTLTAASIPAGGTATFTWSYTENGSGPGTIVLSAGANGTDANSGAAVSAPTGTSSTAAVQLPAKLSVTAFTLPATLSRGQTFTATMTVANTGQTAASNVLPSPLTPTKTVTGTANATTSTAPAAQTIPGGASATFSWTYVENGTGTGTIALAAGATGSDANTGAALSAPAVTSNAAQVQSPPALSVASFSIPSTLSRGQTFTATMVVTNTGPTTAVDVLPKPTPPAKLLTGGADATTATTLTPATIPGGASATFTWSYTESGSSGGSLQLSGGAEGTDPNTGQPVSAANGTSNLATVVQGARLVSTVVAPTAVVAGDPLQVTMTVENTGQASALAVTPSALAAATTGRVNLTLLSAPAATTIAGGAKAVFSWTYNTAPTDAGTVRFTGNASGTDAASGQPVSSTSSSSPACTLVPPGSSVLQVALSTEPRAVAPGQPFTVRMAVTNVTARTVTGVVPSTLALGGTGAATLVSGPAPAGFDLFAAQTLTFAWTWRAEAPGWVTFAGSATSASPANASPRATSSVLAIPAPWCPSSNFAVDAGPDRSTTCAGHVTIGGSPTTSGGNPSYVFEWSPAEGLSNALLANPAAAPRTASTTYVVTATDGDGCQRSDSTLVTVTNAPTATISSGAAEDRRCTGQSFALTRTRTCPAGGCNEWWDHGDGTTSTAANHNKSYAAPGTYQVRYTTTDSAGCRATAAVPVFVGARGVFPAGRITLTPSAPSASANGTSTITFNSQPLRDCEGTLAGASGGMRFTVMTDRGSIVDADVDPATAGVQVDQAAVSGGYGLRFTLRADKVGGAAHQRGQALLDATAQARGWASVDFTGSTTLPQPVAFAPSGAGTASGSAVAASFDKALSPASLTASTFTVAEVGAGTCANPAGATVSGSVSFASPTWSALFVPGAPLDLATRAYVARLTPAVRDVANNPIDGNFNGTVDSGNADAVSFCFGAVADDVPPAISCGSVAPVALSPDGDGAAESSTLTATLSDDLQLKGWRVQIREAGGFGLLRTLNKLRSANGSDSLAWDGRDALGRVVPNGNYVMTASAYDASGNWSAPCSVELSVSSVFDAAELVP